MRRLPALAIVGTAIAFTLGCEHFMQTPEGRAPAEETEAVASEPMGKPVEGRVYRVWPYGNGELMAYMGWRDGLKKGDLLLLTRNGVQVNSVETLHVEEDLFFGRVLDRSDEGLLPKEGDIVVKLPKVGTPATTTVSAE